MADPKQDPKDPEQDPKDPKVPDPKEPKANAVVFTPEQQAAIDKIVGGARTKAREQAQADFTDAQARAKKESEEAAELKELEDSKEYQKVIDTHTAKIALIQPALDAASEQVTKFNAMAEAILKKRIETLGEQAKTAIENLPGEPDVLAKLNWLEANEELFKIKVQPKGTPPKSGVASQAAGNQPPTEQAVPFHVNF